MTEKGAKTGKTKTAKAAGVTAQGELISPPQGDLF
jgi:hypothetical protein